MVSVKEKLIDAITVMSNTDAEKIWSFIQNEMNEKNLWNSIEEEEPAQEELMIIKAYENGAKEYQPCITHEELSKELEL